MTQDNLNTALSLAEVLAAFANLKQADVPAFRKSHPNFAGHDWWDSASLPWTQFQTMVRRAWENGFAPDTCISLIVHGSNLSVIGERLRGFNASLQAMEGEDASVFVKSNLGTPVFDYQRALMFLHVQPWRASRCLNRSCGKYFVKTSKGQMFCSVRCSDAVRAEAKRKWWSEQGTVQRAKKNKAKKKQRRAVTLK